MFWVFTSSVWARALSGEGGFTKQAASRSRGSATPSLAGSILQWHAQKARRGVILYLYSSYLIDCVPLFPDNHVKSGDFPKYINFSHITMVVFLAGFHTTSQDEFSHIWEGGRELAHAWVPLWHESRRRIFLDYLQKINESHMCFRGVDFSSIIASVEIPWCDF